MKLKTFIKPFNKKHWKYREFNFTYDSIEAMIEAIQCRNEVGKRCLILIK